MCWVVKCAVINNFTNPYDRCSCDLQAVRLLCERTLGNSSTKVQKQISEQHCETHLQKVLRFLQAREHYYIQAKRGMLITFKTNLTLVNSSISH